MAVGMFVFMFVPTSSAQTTKPTRILSQYMGVEEFRKSTLNFQNHLLP